MHVEDTIINPAKLREDTQQGSKIWKFIFEGRKGAQPAHKAKRETLLIQLFIRYITSSWLFLSQVFGLPVTCAGKAHPDCMRV